MSKHDSLEQLESHDLGPGNAVTNRGEPSPFRTIHTETSSAVRPVGPLPCSVPITLARGLGRLGG